MASLVGPTCVASQKLKTLRSLSEEQTQLTKTELMENRVDARRLASHVEPTCAAS